MYVNPFWFGFLMGVLAILFLAVVVGAVSKRTEDEYEPVSLEELKEALKEENADDKKDQ